MEMTGRITKDALVKNVKDNKQVVSFTVVLNDYYKPKGGEQKQLSTFFNCSYWISTKVASVLKKGAIAIWALTPTRQAKENSLPISLCT